MQKFFSVTVCSCLCMLVTMAQPDKQQGKIGIQGKDDQGNFINAHGVGILYFSGTYYLFGEIKKGNTYLVPGQNWEDYRVPAGGVSCYSSKDLAQWKYEGIALSPVTGDPDND
ncbi:MAG TPA: hypothetical protein VK622_01395, partial [Puia sp.]|nr:hypothetical protein [Puia sp.]